MWKKVCPDLFYSSIEEIDLDELKSLGIEGIICDLDNTIIPYGKETIPQSIINWFKNIEEKEFNVCLISNGWKGRVERIAKELGIPAFYRAVKPRKKTYKKALEHLKIPPQKIAVIGDQIFTDVLGGNRMGMLTILVDPLAKKEFKTTRIMRLLEKRVKSRLKEEGLFPREQE